MSMTNPLFTIQRTNTILYCKNWAETVRFYKEKLRLPIILENDWFVELQQTDTSFLSIANSARASISDARGQGITLTWKVTNIEQAKELLRTQGISTTLIQRRWNARVFYCYDPEGHRIEFWEEENGEGGGLDD